MKKSVYKDYTTKKKQENILPEIFRETVVKQKLWA